jgi:antitoxin component of RelBE/YafQ-DinJ toxin-antitoxin module
MTVKTRTQANAKNQSTGILLRYRDSDTPYGVSRNTASKLAKTLGLTETQVIHVALARLASQTLPRYEPDDGPLTERQAKAIRKLVPQGAMTDKERLF